VRQAAVEGELLAVMKLLSDECEKARPPPPSPPIGHALETE